MIVLGIETSCDETSCALVADGKDILSNVVATQIPFHTIYKGVVPEIASRKHIEWILPVAREALKTADLSIDKVDAIAATNRPGLVGGLLVGLTFAKGLALALDKPFIAVNHMLGHLYAPRLRFEGAGSTLAEYPFLGLLVSGGHTIICKVDDFDKVEVLGTTIDDSAGEAFDKVAKFYDLGYPGGVVIDRLAKGGDPKAALFPLPIIHNGEACDVSFSGLKTAVIHQRETFWKKGYEYTKENLAASFQEAAVKILVRAVEKAIAITGLRVVVAGGGVAANSRLRALMAERFGEKVQCIFPPLKLCGDNAAMIAGVAYQYLARGERSPLDTNAQARVTDFKHRAAHNR